MESRRAVVRRSHTLPPVFTAKPVILPKILDKLGLDGFCKLPLAGLRVEGLELRVEGLGFRVEGGGFRAEGLELRVEGGLGWRI